ncbi:MAG TPA: type II secretion system F family protein [Thermoanaerobaculia bacterium]|nr:type II secretion system F family protein [Thermoanaerobaculia bacterium]
MQFQCRVGTPEGRVLEQTFVASDEPALMTELGKLGYHVFEVRRRGVPRKLGVSGLLGRRRKAIPMDEFMVWNRELAALLKAGLPLLQALDLMLERMANLHFKAVLTDIRDRVKSGQDLSEAFAEHGELFPRLFPSTLKAGEKSGELEQVIRRFIRYLKLVMDARRRVISALIYPVVLICLSIAMISVMMVYVVPKITLFFENLEVKLPLMTRILIAVSSFAHNNVIWLALGLIAATAAFRAWSRTDGGRLALDRAKLKVPFLGAVLHRFAITEFCRSLATLLAGGIPLVPALEIATDAVGNLVVRRAIEPQIQLVREGKPFHEALERSGVFIEMSIDMIKVGEATGSLDEMLTSVADFLDEQIETRMARILTLIEPLMLVFMGIIVAAILVSIYLPLVSAMGQSSF